MTSAIVTPSSVWHAWSFDPLVVAGLCLAAFAYGRGTLTLAVRGRRPSAARIAAFVGGLVAIVAALMSPVDALGHTLFSAHMVQHLTLLFVAAPLLSLGAPVLPVTVALPDRWRRSLHRISTFTAVRRVTRTATKPVMVWMLQVAALWTWHTPSLYQAALGNDFVHALEHASFLGTALLFWWTIANPIVRRRLAYGPAVLLVFVTALQSGALGAILTFASTPLYDVHALGLRAWGLTALRDQQLAGVLMWVPTGAIYLAAAAVLFVKWLRVMEDEMRRKEGREESVGWLG